MLDRRDMAASGRRRHWAEAFHWPAASGRLWPGVLAAGLGMAAPVLLAAGMGHLHLGLSAALGALMAGSARAGTPPAEHRGDLASALVAAAIAALASSLIAGRGGWTDAGLVLLAGTAALVGGYSRPLAIGTARFVVFLVLTLGVHEGGHTGGGLLTLMGAGALWAALVTLLLDRVFSTAALPSSNPASPSPGSTATAAQKFRRWRKSLAHVSGWQFPLRLTLCLAPAGIVRWLWPGHHMLWIALTVALLCRRQVETSPVQVTQRMFGALAGVAATALLAGSELSGAAIALLMAVLAAAAAWLRERNYLAYTACMTPLIILLLDAGRPIEAGILLDRLLATAIGAGLVIAADVSVTRFMMRQK